MCNQPGRVLVRRQIDAVVSVKPVPRHGAKWFRPTELVAQLPAGFFHREPRFFDFFIGRRGFRLASTSKSRNSMRRRIMSTSVATGFRPGVIVSGDRSYNACVQPVHDEINGRRLMDFVVSDGSQGCRMGVDEIPRSRTRRDHSNLDHIASLVTCRKHPLGFANSFGFVLWWTRVSRCRQSAALRCRRFGPFRLFSRIGSRSTTRPSAVRRTSQPQSPYLPSPSLPSSTR